MLRPLIGITLDNVENTLASGKYEVGVGYSRAVAEAGGVPVLLPHEISRVPDYVQRCDGLILTGGVDPDTSTLPADWPGHAPVHPKARVMDPARQAFELALLAEWDHVKPQGPLLGVCLGMQLLTLHHGGTLNQYLPDTHASDVVERHRKNDHAIRVTVDDSVLQPPTTEAEAITHSNHQQAIADAGTLRVVAVAEDGIIEAVDNPGRPFYLGVQWHPERGDNGPLSRGLMGSLMNALR
ncbi:gamma-glutamyl-gamma-aminobutyrate hydrolase family protein [Algisphaera agarilytica]|uniref:Putative glutamine amidotransferase n=1 Tax=Algisphaera agarilytica TaxID=1385975 RepID=A0A7X0LJJ3_9BACT|nr:gamma-glutamyl-gamma-aminobutyrate hydrolase family protein [Algisphaera agarilytica]MBB6428671.1 putative glutamine amidotransferase [Algisphaera agarilytica]